jgi:1,4-dihydroxy-2-naphthoate octaprenyltransferase
MGINDAKSTPLAKYPTGIFGIVLTFGVTATLGRWQIKTGRRDKRVIYLMTGLAALMSLIAVANSQRVSI